MEPLRVPDANPGIEPAEQTRARARAGARLIDRTLGRKSWRAKVRVEQLDFLSCHNCLLGQVFGGYATGMACLKLDWRKLDAIPYGFAPGTMGTPSPEQMREAWRIALQEE